MSLPKDARFWIGVSFIVASVLGVYLWVFWRDPEKLTPLQEIGIQTIFLLSSIFGAFLLGLPIQESRPQIRVSDRYQNLRAVLIGIHEVINYLNAIEDKPRLSQDQRAEGMLRDYEMVSGFIRGHSSQWVMGLESCLVFWNEYAPEQVGQMHRSLFGEREGN